MQSPKSYLACKDKLITISNFLSQNIGCNIRKLAILPIFRRVWYKSRNIIALASATGEKTSAPLARTQIQRPTCQGQGGAEGPDAGSLTEEGAEGPRRLGRNKRPLGKKFSTKVENWPALLYTITQNSKLSYPENHFPDQLETWNFAVFVLSMYLGGPESIKSLRVKMCPWWRHEKRVFSKTFVWSIYIYIVIEHRDRRLVRKIGRECISGTKRDRDMNDHAFWR